MAEPVAEDHDQRLKVLLKEFIEQFFQCFFPDWAAWLDFSNLTWMDKEVFLAPPQGEKRRLDLVARIGLKPDAPPAVEGRSDLLVLVHIEVESGESSQPIKPRMFEYYVELRREFQLPVLPIGLFLRVGLDGIGWDAYEEHFWDRCVLSFQYCYIGLPALDGERYAAGENVLGAALSSLMRVSSERRAELHLEALKRIAESGENDWRQFLLAECLEAYSKLDEEQRQRLEILAKTEPFEKVRPLMATTYERVRSEGKLEGRLETLRETLIMILDAKFDSLLPPGLAQKLNSLTAEQLQVLTVTAGKAKSLEELNLPE